jgi:hypothetical protein
MFIMGNWGILNLSVQPHYDPGVVSASNKISTRNILGGGGGGGVSAYYK